MENAEEMILEDVTPQIGFRMSDVRPVIPASLERQLMIESGYRCAICKTPEPLQIEHIEEWAKVREHQFENMIVLCANCHARKKNSSDPRHVNRSSLKAIKANLMLLNGRYSDLERRIIDTFREDMELDQDAELTMVIPERLYVLVGYLIGDGLVDAKIYESPITSTFPDGTIIRDDSLKLTLSAIGREFIRHLNASL